MPAEFTPESFENTWQGFRNLLIRWPENSPRNCSNKRSLLAIAGTAEAWGLDPSSLFRAYKCNLETMIRQAKLAIEYQHPEDLQELFNQAAEMSNANFRMFCGRARRAINVRHQNFGGNEEFVIVLDQPMMEVLEHRTRYDFSFIKHE